MQLNSIAIDKAAIIMKVVANKETDDSKDLVESKITAKEEPLPSLMEAWNELPAVFCKILQLPADYITGLAMTKLAVSRTKYGTRSVTLHATKQLECRSEFLHKLSTPCVLVEKVADGESGAVQIDKALCDIILEALHESERYMAGDRGQGVLNFDEAKAALNATAEKGQKALAL